jgi:hypothetical protein
VGVARSTALTSFFAATELTDLRSPDDLARTGPAGADVILHLNVPCAGASPAYLEIDKLPDGRYRATVGTLFEHQEIWRTGDLEALVRQANLMASCRSFDDMVNAIRTMRTLG